MGFLGDIAALQFSLFYYILPIIKIQTVQQIIIAPNSATTNPQTNNNHNMNPQHHTNNLFLFSNEANDPDFEFDMQIHMTNLYEQYQADERENFLIKDYQAVEAMEGVEAMGEVQGQSGQQHDGQGLGEGFGEFAVEGVDVGQEYVRTTRKALDQFHELKNYIGNNMNHGQYKSPRNGTILQQQNSQSQYKQHNHHQTKKRRRPQNLPNLPNLSYQTPPQFPKPHRRILHNLNNLKSISHEVCDFVECSELITYSELFKKFIGHNQKEAKNLRRRMYDVINVLSSAKVLRKRGLTLQRYNSLENVVTKPCLQMNRIHRSQTLTSLEQSLRAKQKMLQQKKKHVYQLIQAKNRLAKLYKRNEKRTNSVPFNQRIYFPLVFFIKGGNRDVQCHVDKNQVSVTWGNKINKSKSMRPEYQPIERLYFREVDVLRFIKFRKRRNVTIMIDDDEQVETYNKGMNVSRKENNTQTTKIL